MFTIFIEVGYSCIHEKSWKKIGNSATAGSQYLVFSITKISCSEKNWNYLTVKSTHFMIGNGKIRSMFRTFEYCLQINCQINNTVCFYTSGISFNKCLCEFHGLIPKLVFAFCFISRLLQFTLRFQFHCTTINDILLQTSILQLFWVTQMISNREFDIPIILIKVPTYFNIVSNEQLLFAFQSYQRTNGKLCLFIIITYFIKHYPYYENKLLPLSAVPNYSNYMLVLLLSDTWINSAMCH